MLTLGKNENFILTAREDGIFDLFNIKKYDDINYSYKISSVNLTRETNLNNNVKNININISLPLYSSFDSLRKDLSINMPNEIINVIKKQIKSTTKIFAIDKSGNLLVMISLINSNEFSNGNLNPNINSKEINNNSNINRPLLKRLYSVDLNEKLKFLLNKNTLKIYEMKRFFNEINTNNTNTNKDFDFEKTNKNFNIGNETDNYNNNDDIFFINSNLGLFMIKLIGKNDCNIRIIYNNFNEKNILSSFDVSDSGLILAGFADLSIRVIEMKDFKIIFQLNLPIENISTIIDKIFWASVICKSDNNNSNKLIRKSLTANIFVITNKNEFIIFDLNQKSKADLRTIKKKIELSAKKKLNRLNSIVDYS
jgi:hypothetical protein